MDDSKLCSKCKTVKPIAAFYKRTDGAKATHRSACRECTKPKNRVTAARWREANPDKVKVHNATFKAVNPDYGQAWYASNLEHARAKRRAYQKAHPAQGAARTAKYRCAKLQRTPVWYEEQRIREFYEACPEGHHVDHRIPLQGETVSGLHVIGNLQYLTAEDNISKGNKC